MEVKEIIELMKAMSENGMTGFELAEGDWKLTMKREKKVVAAAQGRWLPALYNGGIPPSEFRRRPSRRGS